MLQSFIQAILSVFARIAERLVRESKTARDATSDDAALHRAGGRIRDWMHSRRSGAGEKPDQGGSGDKGTDLRS